MNNTGTTSNSFFYDVRFLEGNKLEWIEIATNKRLYTTLNDDDTVGLTDDPSDPNILKISMID